MAPTTRPRAPSGSSLAERIAFHTGPALPTGCRPWLAAKVNGYGVISHKGKVIKVTRVLLADRLGRGLRRGMQACHTCDNRWCVEPSHLWEGTVKDNASDMVKKGRSLYGEKNHHVKLSKVEIRQILRLLGRVPQAEIARQFGVCRSTITHINTGRNWKRL